MGTNERFTKPSFYLLHGTKRNDAIFDILTIQNSASSVYCYIIPYIVRVHRNLDQVFGHVSNILHRATQFYGCASISSY